MPGDEAVKDYHKTVLTSLQQYMDADAAQRDRQQMRVRRLQPATLERTAWDLALVSQSLADIDGSATMWVLVWSAALVVVFAPLTMRLYNAER